MILVILVYLVNRLVLCFVLFGLNFFVHFDYHRLCKSEVVHSGVILFSSQDAVVVVVVVAAVPAVVVAFVCVY